jgi:hypothetical protein
MKWYTSSWDRPSNSSASDFSPSSVSKGQLASLQRELVAEQGVLLLAHQQPPASCEPFLAWSDLVVSHLSILRVIWWLPVPSVARLSSKAGG